MYMRVKDSFYLSVLMFEFYTKDQLLLQERDEQECLIIIVLQIKCMLAIYI